MTKLRLLLPLVLVTALLAGCGGSSTSTPTVRLADTVAPTTEATNVKATGGPEQVNLSWEAASTTNLLGWLVEYSTAGSGVWTKAPQLAATSLTDALKLKPASYEFRVWAIVKQAPATATATSEEAPTPPPPPPPPPSGFLPGLNAGYWGSGEYSDLHALARGKPFVVRLENPPALTPWEAAGIKVDALENHYVKPAGVSGLNHGEFVAKVVNFVKANPHAYAVEVLNEPGGQWFWGEAAESQTNRESYGHLLIEVHNALVANFGAARPLELCSWDGGHDSSNAWGEAWSKVPGSVAACDGVTSHPYGGHGANSTTILGNRHLVEAAHAKSGKPVYVTEVGFPTKEATGDSNRYTEAEQAWALYHFMGWAASTGYVDGVDFYGYRGDNYGIKTQAGTQKKAWKALEQFDAGEACTVCT